MEVGERGEGVVLEMAMMKIAEVGVDLEEEEDALEVEEGGDPMRMVTETGGLVVGDGGMRMEMGEEDLEVGNRDTGTQTELEGMRMMRSQVRC